MKNLKKKSLNAFLWDLGGTFGQKGLRFITTIFLARLLSPEEFGIVGMAMVFISIFQVFSDVGFTKGLIQSQTNTSVTYSSIFYINILIGSVLTIGTYFGAPLVGDFYQNDEVTEVLRFLSLIFVFSSFNIVQKTILEKELKMKILNIRGLIGRILGGIVGVTMAFMGYGVFSIVAQALTASIATTLILWSVTNWYPRLEFSTAEVKRLFGFSGFVFLDQILSRIFREINTLFIGKMFSPSTLGFFSRADSFNKLIINFSSSSLKKVFFPVLSQLQDENEQYLKVYYKLIAVVTFISFGLTGVLFILGDTLIIGLFGSKWEPSVIIFQVLVLKGYVYPISVMINNAFLSRGKAKVFFYLGLVRKFSRLIPVGIGIFFGFKAFLIAFIIVSNLIMVYNIFVAKMYNNLSFWNHFKYIIEGIISLSIFIVPVYLFLESTMLIDILISFVFVIYYLLYGYLRKHDGVVFVLNNLKPLLKK